MLTLFAVTWLDELGSGIAPASAGDVAVTVGVPATLVAGGIITAFHSLALFVEAPLLALSERLTVRRFLGCALWLLAASLALAAATDSPWLLAISLALYGPASGCALAASEGALVESQPSHRERTLARLGLSGAVGDLCVPLLLAVLAVGGLGYQSGMAVAACSATVLALSVSTSGQLSQRPLPAEQGADEEPSASVFTTLRLALSLRPLVAWSLAAFLANLLDEVLVAFVVVRLQSFSPLLRSLAVAAFTVGVLVGLALLERHIERLDAGRVMWTSIALVTATLIAVALTDSAPILLSSLLLLGAAASSLHPLASARAYAALPGRPALVNAVGAALMPLEAVTPLLLSAVALRYQAQGALLALLIAPLGFSICLCCYRPSKDRVAD